MKLLAFIAMLMLLYAPASANSCLDTQYLQLLGESSQEYYSTAFVFCVKNNDCTTAKKLLDTLKDKDQVQYSFLMGSALSNGDCYKADPKAAEKHLTFCAKYSDICKSSLIMFYGIFAKFENQYIEYALSLAEQGDTNSLSFLADYYASQGTAEGLVKSYFWARIIFLKLEAGVKANAAANLSPLAQGHYESLLQFRAEILESLKDIEAQLPKIIVRKLKAFSQKWYADLPQKPRKIDPLEGISGIYGVIGIALSSLGNASPTAPGKLEKISPPPVDFSENIAKYEAEIKNLLM